MIETVDGAVLAQLGLPDMRIPIQFALTYPQRSFNPFPKLDFTKVGALNFEIPDRTVFPALDLAYWAGRTGGTAPAVLNAANEVAVALFLEDKISFRSIVGLVRTVLESHQVASETDIESILQADLWARREVARVVNNKGGDIN
jgi:1-deoxy-D-xylulose-5-phosphate reductoisomerase